MKRTLTVCVLMIGLFLLTGKDSFAGTDLLSNALTQSNSFLKEAGLVQKKYSGIARKIVTTKVSINLDELGGEKVQKYREKAENLKEKAEKVQERIETAKERKAELMAKYNELNAKALEYKAKADEYLEEAQNIKEQYQTYKDEVTGAIDQAKNAKAQIDEAVNGAKETLGATENEGGENTSEATDEPTEGTEEDNGTNLEKTEQSKQAQAIRLPDAQPQETEASLSSVRSVVSNRADTVRSASALAGSTAAENTAVVLPSSEDLPEIGAISGTVSISDVMTAAEAEEDPAAEAEELRSDMNLEEQLLQASNRSGAVKGKTTEGVRLIDADSVRRPAAVRDKFVPARQPQALPAAKEAIAREKTDVEKL